MSEEPCSATLPPVTPASESRGRLHRLRSAAGGFLTGHGLPAFLTAAAAVYEAFLLLVIFAPPGWGAWSVFSEEFKIWCFSYDPRTGGMEWMSVVIMLAEPLFIVGLLLLVWSFGHTALDKAGGWRRHHRAALVGLCVGLSAAGGLYAYGRPSPEAEALLPFPGERIRTQLAPPDFSLVDHRGNPASLAGLRGRVTLITGVYALCSMTCPDILVQVKELSDTLPPEVRERFGVVAMSLNPEYDTAELMGAVAEAYGFTYPHFRYLNGQPSVMNPLLRDFQFAARRNPETGQIDHANLFILVDAEGRIAYRFNLDRRHRGWLREAVLALTSEVADVTTSTEAAIR
jgi:protein SCO1/2